MEKIRTFICIEITNKKIIDKIVNVQKEFESLKGKIKSTERENIHITLKFLGNISTQDSEKIINLLNNVKFRPFDLNLAGIGCFPNPYRARIIWVGTKAGAENVKNIHDQIDSQLKPFHFKKEKFQTHITISRIRFLDRSSLTNFKKLLDVFQDKDFGTIKISSFQFKKSILTPKGPIYTTLKDFNMT
ncbi:MAG: RNA 2',3'-cyclic phosphodiesterase [Candidatus Helarchaeota archaeon]